jgi:hypothetical protein
VNFKLLRAVGRFDPSKGSAFTFISQVVMNVLCTSVSNARRNTTRYTRLSRPVLNKLVTGAEHQTRDVVADVVHRTKGNARTTLTDPVELSAQRWLVESFCADGFEHRRHECADAAMAVYGLNHDRSRELYDLTILELRRILYDNLSPRPQIAPGRLTGG